MFNSNYALSSYALTCALLNKGMNHESGPISQQATAMKKGTHILYMIPTLD